MQDIIARALALRNNGSSSGASAELAQKVQKIEDEYVRATDEKDIEEISSSIEAIKQEIEDKGIEVKASLDSTSANDVIQYYCFANDSLYKTNSAALGNATVTETKLTVDEVADLVSKAHTANIIFFSGDSLFTSSKNVVYKVVDAYEGYGYHYFTTIKSDRANTTSAAYTLCVRSYNRD